MQKIDPSVIRFFQALSDETRLRILVAISEEPRTVNEIHQAVGDISLSAVSHQLSMMEDIGIVQSRRDGRNKFFSLSKNFCWCILRDAFSYFGQKKRCPHCAHIEEEGGILRKVV